MQQELERHNPSLDVYLAGINENGQQSANGQITQSLPVLQDIDNDSNGSSDVWASWQAAWRDVKVVDRDNELTFTINLTTNSLADSANYQQLKQALINAGRTTPTSQYQSAVEPLDVDSNGFVAPLDALLVINELGVHPDGRPPQLPNGTLPSSYFDPTGDGIVAPFDALSVINHLNLYSSSNRAPLSAQGEVDTPAPDGESATLTSLSVDYRSDAMSATDENIRSAESTMDATSAVEVRDELDFEITRSRLTSRSDLARSAREPRSRETARVADVWDLALAELLADR